ncbi:MAG: hypothetical protein ACRDMZ_18345 [Solirubrobacteraceae bacterium]
MTLLEAAAPPFAAAQAATAFTPGDGAFEMGRERRADLIARLPLAVAGVVPVSLIAGSAFGLNLRLLALLILAPILACVFVRMAVHRATRSLVGYAIGAGIIATTLYDLCRGAFLWLGLMDHDPIPHIGLALGADPAWLAGYTWRYLGNGAGLALTFLALGLRGIRIGLAYGLGVCACLLVTLIVSPHGTTILFPLNVTTVIMATLGHAIYGVALGTIAARRHEHATSRPHDRSFGALTLSGHGQIVRVIVDERQLRGKAARGTARAADHHPRRRGSSDADEACAG